MWPNEFRFALALMVLLVAASVSAQTPPPNIVLIMSDDMGYGDLGSYGAPDVRTPNIDTLAREGIKLTDFYANGVLCSPTRAGLISGRYQHRYGIESALGSGPLAEGLVVTGNSLPQLLRDADYTTGLVGKWHLGMVDEHSPGSHGFDYFFGFRGAYIDFYQHDRGPNAPDLWENDTRIEREGYMTDLITEETVNFIERSASDARPFFVDVAYNAPHWPYQPPDMPSISRNNAGHLQPHTEGTSTRADYVAMVERVDQGVGEILATLDRLGLADNTLVIFTNDNGGEWLARNAPLFHRKWTVWEGGIRVPAVARWPGRIPAGRVSDQVGITMDLTATILSVANASVPTDLEGMNLMPIWVGENPEVERTLFWRTNVGGQTQRAVRSGDWKLVIDGNATFVFNLRLDPGERQDMANQRQDIAARLRPLHDAWLQDITAEAVDRGLAQPPPARGRGAGPGGN